MWISDRLNGAAGAELPHMGRVTRVQGRRADIDSYMRLADVECVSGFGVSSLPALGEEVLVLPALGGYYCLGQAAAEGASEGEILLRSAGGGSLHLKADGSVCINGLTITKDGRLLMPAAGKEEP